MPTRAETATQAMVSQVNGVLKQLGRYSDSASVSVAVGVLVLQELQKLRDAVVSPPKLDLAGPAFLVYVVTVVTAGTPVQGPDIAIPRGYGCVVRMRRHTGGSPTGYVAGTQPSLGNTLTRSEMQDNDVITLPGLSNLDQVWFDANANTTRFELILEYAR